MYRTIFAALESRFASSCPGREDTFRADLTRHGIVTRSNFVHRSRTGGRATLLFISKPVQRCFLPSSLSLLLPPSLSPSIGSNLRVRSLVHPRTSAYRAAGHERMIREYRCLLVQSSSKLRRVYDRGRVDERSMRKAKKDYCLRARELQHSTREKERRR